MKVIRKQARTARDILGSQKLKPDTQGRFLTYCVAVTCDDGLLLYNVMTKELVLLEGQESALINAENLNESALLQNPDSELFRSLFESWFLVPEDHDDKKLCLDLREVALLLQKTTRPNAITGYTILTTTDCNARCFYCYEKDCKHVDMSPQIALKAVDFIEENCGGKRVALSWFGGEPLYNLEIIDLITDELTKRGIAYNSRMTTNGYLFDDEVIRKAVEQWKLQRVQITLDGTEDIYNRRKAYIYDEGSAFKRVTDNIECLLEAGIRVTVRLNMDERNFDDLMQLCDWMAQRYKGQKKLSAYARYMFKIDEQVGVPFQGDIETLCKDMLLLEKKLRSIGLQGHRKLRNSLKLNCCMADSDDAILIQADGSLGQCEHFYDSLSCGSVEAGIQDEEAVAYWKELKSDAPVCDSCPMYPDCIRLVGCSTSYANACQKVYAFRNNKYENLKQDISNCYSDIKA